MALDPAPLLTRQSKLAFALETTTNTPATTTTAAAVTPCWDVTFNHETERVDRESQGSISKIRQGLGARSSTIEFTTELYNGASGLPYWTNLLLACGMQENAGTFSPLTAANQTMTFRRYMSGRTKIASGCMGTWTLTGRRGQAAMFRWRFVGCQQPPDSTTLAAPTYDTGIAPRVGAATFTIGGVSTYIVPDFEIEWGTSLKLRESISDLDTNNEPIGYRGACIPDRETIIRFRAESLALTNKDWYKALRDSTTAAMSIVIGSEANNTFTITAPKLQLVTDPNEEDDEGLMRDTLEFVTLRDSDAGDDDLTIAFS